jgi:DeoR/GlpR family transcriptional regulator of sugar metabolism
MKKSKIDERREYVKEVVSRSPRTTRAVKDLSEQLFLSEQTIWNDLKH